MYFSSIYESEDWVTLTFSKKKKEKKELLKHSFSKLQDGVLKSGSKTKIRMAEK